MTQELRQGLNKIDVAGVIKEHKLNKGKSDNGNYINGSLVVKTGEFSEVEVKVFVNEKNKEGKVKKAYETLHNILEGKYPTMADIKGTADEIEEQATKVSIWGNNGFTPQFKEEMYKNSETGEAITKVSIDLGFGNVTIKEKLSKEDYKAGFDIEMFVKEVVDEEKGGELTGRAIIKGYIPVYGGTVIPLQIVAGIVEDEEGEFDFGEVIRGGVATGDSINVWGNIDYKSIVTKTKKGGGLGRAKIEEKREYVHDLVAVGAEIIEDVEKQFDVDAIKEALKQRTLAIEEVKNKEDKPKEESKGLGKPKGAGLSGNKSKPQTPQTVTDDDDLPF